MVIRKSPKAPSMSLPKAIREADRVFAKEQTAAFGKEALGAIWSYKVGSGSFNRRMSTLLQYGLIEKKADNRYVVSRSFLEIIKPGTGDENRKSAKRDAFLKPKIFAELYRIFGKEGFPSVENVKFELMSRGFIESSAAHVAGVFRESLEYVGLDRAAEPPNEEEVEYTVAEFGISAPEIKDAIYYTQEIPLGAGRRIIIKLPESLTAEEIDKAIKILEVLKP